MVCKYLDGNNTTWYQCKFTKRKCGYQRYCSDKKQFIVSCEKCPICQNKNTKINQK